MVNGYNGHYNGYKQKLCHHPLLQKVSKNKSNDCSYILCRNYILKKYLFYELLEFKCLIYGQHLTFIIAM